MNLLLLRSCVALMFLLFYETPQICLLQNWFKWENFNFTVLCLPASRVIQSKLRYILQYSSQIVETETVFLEFSRKFLNINLHHTFVLSQMHPSPSPMLWYPNQHWGRGKAHKYFKICDEYCWVMTVNPIFTSGFLQKPQLKCSATRAILWLLSIMNFS